MGDNKLRGITVNEESVESYLDKHIQSDIETERKEAIRKHRQCIGTGIRMKARYKDHHEKNGPVKVYTQEEIAEMNAEKSSETQKGEQYVNPSPANKQILEVLFCGGDEDFYTRQNIADEIANGGSVNAISTALNLLKRSPVGKYMRKQHVGKKRVAWYLTSEARKMKFQALWNMAIGPTAAVYSTSGAVSEPEKKITNKDVLAKLGELVLSGKINIEVNINVNWR